MQKSICTEYSFMVVCLQQLKIQTVKEKKRKTVLKCDLKLSVHVILYH